MGCFGEAIGEDTGGGGGRGAEDPVLVVPEGGTLGAGTGGDVCVFTGGGGVSGPGVGGVFDRVTGTVVTFGVGDMDEAVAAAATGGGLAGVTGCAPPERSGLAFLTVPLAFVSGRGTFVSARNL